MTNGRKFSMKSLTKLGLELESNNALVEVLHRLHLQRSFVQLPHPERPSRELLFEDSKVLDL